MLEVILVYVALAFAISTITIKEDRLQKKISQGFNPKSRDNDKDGLVQEGTKWERKVKK